MRTLHPWPLALAALALGGLLGASVSAARTGPARAPSDAGRYQFHATESGALVMDTATGTVKVMGSGRTGTWAADYSDLTRNPAPR